MVTPGLKRLSVGYKSIVEAINLTASNANKAKMEVAYITPKKTVIR